ncbi:MAG: hypothetical protein IJ681_10435 [Bacteroidales bacterium]|nr:hypothetical protein [Bacteroidales bacterium]
MNEQDLNRMTGEAYEILDNTDNAYDCYEEMYDLAADYGVEIDDTIQEVLKKVTFKVGETRNYSIGDFEIEVRAIQRNSNATDVFYKTSNSGENSLSYYDGKISEANDSLQYQLGHRVYEYFTKKDFGISPEEIKKKFKQK